MKVRGKLLLAVTAVAVLFTTTAYAQGPHGHRGGWGDAAILRAVGLSDAQKTQIRQIFANHRPTLQSLRQQLMAVQGQLRDKLYSATPPTAADLAPVNQLRDQLAAERLALSVEIRNVLTPDQLTKAAQIRQQLKDLRQQQRQLLTPPPTS